MATSSVFEARYRGRCYDCGASILPGDPVRFDGTELVHDDCGDVPMNVDVEAAACRSCFQIPAVSGACGCEVPS